MKINVKTGGILRHYLPDGSGSQCELEVADGATALAVMEQLGLPGDDHYLVMLNGTVLQVDLRGSTVLSENDDLGLFPPLKGG
ncbi:MAG: MoaD/ThiS family protein [Rhizobiales bacterium]|nr:MoaD/ThiS family protein [Hyphomicrobiales bacterium]